MTETFPTRITLKRGNHRLPSDGASAMEAAVLVAGYGWTEIKDADDLPLCMSAVIGAYIIALNDAMPDDERQRLMRFITRIAGTERPPETERQRAEYLIKHAARPAAVEAFRYAGICRKLVGVFGADDARSDWEGAAAAVEEAARDAAKAVALAEARLRMTPPLARNAAYLVGTAVAIAADGVGADFDWPPYLAALDGALAIGPQADPIDVAVVRERVKVLENAAP